MPRPYKEVFFTTKNGDKTYFHRCGAAFINSDGSMNVVLNALPLDGKLHIRDPKTEE